MLLSNDQPTLWGLRYSGWVIVTLIVLTALKFCVAAFTPIAFDEALYWRYSKHLAAGFIDHPFMNPLMIRIGTSMFGDTPFGVRFMAVALSVPASWAVWRASFALFFDSNLAATASLLFSLTVVMTAGSVVATSDEIVVVTTTFLLLFLSKLDQTGHGVWWLAIGAAFGLGMCAKYTTIFFGISIAFWLIIIPANRRWFVNPWTWGGGLVAVLVFSSVLLWNAQHGWESFIYQSGRLTIYNWTFRYFLEFLGALIVLATPPIFILGCIGFVKALTPGGPLGSAKTLLVLMIAPLLAYLLWHSTHLRVQGNWSEPIYPPLSILAAYAVVSITPQAGAIGALARWSWVVATPFALGLALTIDLEATTGFIPLGEHDPRARVLGVGWDKVGQQLDALRAQTGAQAILTTDYTLNSWTRFYLPSRTPIEQFDERVRWTNEPAPDPHILSGTALYICSHSCWKLPRVQHRYLSTKLISILYRENKGVPAERYNVYELKGPIAPVLDTSSLIPRADHND